MKKANVLGPGDVIYFHAIWVIAGFAFTVAQLIAIAVVKRRIHSDPPILFISKESSFQLNTFAPLF